MSDAATQNLTLTPADRDHLARAADLAYAGLDLRYDGGPWIDELDRLVARGLLACHETEWGYLVGYSLTPAGRTVLAAAEAPS
ncbi:MAG: hypothetical protein H6745_26400 [Deltaproteobacteria bacterium]|nr:hypothetical protein [Deltaproteobacteria bacterium]